MTYKDKETYNAYQKGYYSGCRRMTIAHLGGECVECGESNILLLEIHHKEEIYRQSRNIKDLSDLEELEVRCKKHHKKGRLF